MKNLLVRLLLTFLFLGPVPALAQSGSRVVAVCGTLPAPYAAGSTQPPTVDVNGVTCSNSSGGGGGAVTIADGADVTQGALADAVATAGGAGSLSAKLRLMTTQLGTLNTTLGSPFQAGGSIANTAFGISGTLPAFAATPTFNLGTLNGAATAANQSTMATNQTGGGQKTQIVDGSGNVISATANALDINIKSGSAAVAASENHIGEVGGNILPIPVAVTTTAVATIATGDSIGGIQTFSNAVRVSGALGAPGTSGFIQDGVLVFTDTSIIGPLDIYFFNAALTTSTCTNDSTFALTAADYGKVIGIAHVTDATATTLATAPITLQFGNLARAFGLASSTTLRACIVWRGSATITTTANSSSQFTLNVLRN